ncbi:MAG TPA: glycosyltransferase family 4 protein [Acidimicrobiales bacterium]|jgi:glycosyltransferase involved in cell wall biosynthesis
MRALFVVPYPHDTVPGQRFRFEQWLPMLPPGSVDVDVRPLFSAAAYRQLYEPGRVGTKLAGLVAGLARRVRDLVTAGRYDVALLYREAFALGPAILDVFLERRLPVVYDFDDAIFLGRTSANNRSVQMLKWPQKVAQIVAGATITTVGNDWLAGFAREFSDHVVVLPTTIDVEKYRVRPARRHEFVRLGWSGSPTTVEHLHTVDRPLARLLDDLPLELTVVGDAAYSLPGTESLALRVSARAWSAATEVDDIASFDIGIMPLPDDDWSRGKCGLKALQYLAAGVATVASPVGVNSEIIRPGDNGLLASGEEEWYEAVRSLATDEQLRRRLGAAGRRTVVERYSGQRWAPRFLDVLEQAASTRLG